MDGLRLANNTLATSKTRASPKRVKQSLVWEDCFNFWRGGPGGIFGPPKRMRIGNWGGHKDRTSHAWAEVFGAYSSQTQRCWNRDCHCVFGLHPLLGWRPSRWALWALAVVLPHCFKTMSWYGRTYFLLLVWCSGYWFLHQMFGGALCVCASCSM